MPDDLPQPVSDADLKTCPRCGAKARYIKPGVSKRTQQPYPGFFSCGDELPCQERDGSGSLTWHTTKQWAFLRDTKRRGGR